MRGIRDLSRIEAILLGVCIICIILAVGLVKDFGINAQLNAHVAKLQNQVDSYENIINFRDWDTWVYNQTVSQPANSYTSWTYDAEYSGWVEVQVDSSTTNQTYVEVIYSNPPNYDQRIVVGSNGLATFPVLPWHMEVRVGNSNLMDGATENVTITYFY
jgi:hypothetical protein